MIDRDIRAAIYEGLELRKPRAELHGLALIAKAYLLDISLSKEDMENILADFNCLAEINKLQPLP